MCLAKKKLARRVTISQSCAAHEGIKHNVWRDAALIYLKRLKSLETKMAWGGSSLDGRQNNQISSWTFWLDDVSVYIKSRVLLY